MKSYRRKNDFDFGDFTITKREILASISIIAIMLLIGVLISSKISERIVDNNEKYNKAVKIEKPELFDYGMRTNVGNAFVYGELKAKDTVTYSEIGGKYMYISKIKQRHTKHTKRVKHTRTVNGKSKTYYTTETYWTWDTIHKDSKKCDEVLFCGNTFKSNKIDIPSAEYIKTIKESSKIRYKYYGTDAKHKGTIFADLRNETIPYHTSFYENRDINETLDMLQSGFWLVSFFWIFWLVLIGFVVYVFYFKDNDWLE